MGVSCWWFRGITLVGALGLLLAAGSWAVGAAPNTVTVCPGGPPACDYGSIQDAVDAAAGSACDIGAYERAVFNRRFFLPLLR